MADDHLRFEASFSKLDEAVTRAVAALEEELKSLQAKGDTVRTAQVEAQIGELQKFSGAGQAAQVQETVSALEQEGAALARNLEISVENLNVLRLQAEQIAAINSLTREGVVAPRVILPTERRGVASKAETAGGIAGVEGRIAAELALLERQRTQMASITEQLAEQNALRAQAVKLEEEQAAANARAYSAGAKAGATGGLLTDAERAKVSAPSKEAGLAAGQWTAGNAALARYNATLGEYDALSTRSNASTQAMTANLTKVGVAEANASNQLRSHGALTTEWIGALARGETTLSELGYQMGATIAKFGGWVTAAAAVYVAFDAVKQFGKGAIDAASGVQQLNRTIDHLDPSKASQALQGLSKDVNVPIKEAADAVFAFSRTFHNLDEAVGAARLGLAAYKLDNVQVSDSVKLQTVLNQQFGLGLQGMRGIYDLLSAGQREYNARLSEMTPLIQKSAGAVKNAGGDLQSLIQLGIYAQRVTQLSGTQIGTAFYRSAATFLNPATSKGQTDIKVLQEQFGIDTSKGYTSTLTQALEKAGTLSGAKQAQLLETIFGKLPGAVFGPQFGGRLAAIFNPQNIPTYEQIAGRGGDPRRAITPGATAGGFDRELKQELATARERLHSFTNEMQRFGVALGASGVINLFSKLIQAMNFVGGAVRGVVNAFDALPGTFREVLEVAVALRAAMLLLSRTRFGASIPGSRFARIPGLDPSYESQGQRAELARGGRVAITTVKDDLAQTISRQNALAAQRLELTTQAERLQGEIAAGEGDVEAQQTRYNALAARVVALGRQETELAAERLAQEEALAGLKRQQVGITGTRGNPQRYSDKQIGSLYEGLGPEEAAITGDTAAARQLAIQKERLASLQRLNAEANGEVAAANEEEIAAIEANIAAMEAAGVATAGATAAGKASAPVATGFAARLRGARASITGFGSRLGAMVTSIDPLFAAMIVLPILWGKVKDSLDKQSAVIGEATHAANEVVSTVDRINQQVADLQAAAKKQRSAFSPSIPGVVQGADAALFHLPSAIDSLLGVEVHDVAGARQSQQLAGALQVVSSVYAASASAFTKDAQALTKTKAGRERLYQISLEMKQDLGRILQESGLSPAQVGAIYQGFINNLQTTYAAALAANAKGKNIHDALAALEAVPDLETIIKPAVARAETFGLSKGSFSQLSGAVLLMAARYRNSQDPQQLQQLQQSEQSLDTAITKNVGDLLKAAQQAPTRQAAGNLVAQAVSTIHQEEARVRAWEQEMIRKFGKYPGAIAAIQALARMLDQTIGGELQQAIQADLDQIKVVSDYKKSQIQGSGPGAEIARAQQDLSGLQQEYAKAKADGAKWEQLTQILTQINDAQNNLAKLQLDNARSLIEEQGRLAAASITGISPADDIARARAAVSAAQQLLSFDQAHGADQRQIIEDQIALYDAIHSLNQTLQQQAQQAAQDAANLIQAQAAYSESLTLDPIKQAQEALAAEQQILGTIQPSNYQTSSEYQAAVLQQKAKINDARTKVQEAIVQQDLRTLQFEFNTQKIGDQAYINGLERILKTKKLALQERQQIEEQIYNLKQGLGKELQLNVGQIKLPSIYQIRRAIGLGQRGEIPGAQNTVINHTASVTVNVYGPRGASAVGAVLDQHLNTSIRAAMRARGAIR